MALDIVLRALRAVALKARATPTSPTVAQKRAHLHHERMISVEEYAGTPRASEWAEGQHVDAQVAQLAESGARVHAGVSGRTAEGRPLDQAFAHPVRLVTFLLLHDGYHHEQVKLVLKAAAINIPDDCVSALVWEVWRERGHSRTLGDLNTKPDVQ